MDSKEIWREMPLDYDGEYLVSNKGRIKSLHTGNNHKGEIIKKCFQDKDGYWCVPLRKNGKTTSARVHRLVALAFIENPLNLPQVNHKDENKQNNNVKNLEWCTNKYNLTYGTIIQRRVSKIDYSAEHRKDISRKNGATTSKKVYMYTKGGEFIREFNSSHEVARELGYNQSSIINCCVGRTKTSYGYIWKHEKIQ